MTSPNTLDSFETLVSLKELLNDDLKPIIVTFLKHTPITLNKLQRAIKAENTTQVKDLAHLLKGSSANLGLMAFSEQCYVIEKSANEDADYEQLQTNLASLITHAENLQQRLEQFIIEY
ncbi:hypothetical protein THIAE_00250 [Thiomicrospira aerophila AL3]|uniref:HPt domain-containing protein n=1 Tax=Thiomicrospira aerophila AL3 TaxID=717772 RepID=W0DYX8_9GAMM|nr:Hpt domain-containing protein [Thiomicrospira aerophila]AHF02169.1 hypothetical protein THIAE_00250 [Thiomicrospira aerophila AL3]